MRFTVDVVEEHVTSTIRRKTFEAKDAAEAQDLAEAEDWRTWEEVSEGSDTNAQVLDVYLAEEEA